MAVASLVRRVLQTQIRGANGAALSVVQAQPRRDKYTLLKLPEPGVDGKSYRRIIHFEDTYTVKPLKTTNLAGRDPVTGRVIVKGIGGGVKHKYHWIKWIREGPTDLKEPPREERVLNVFPDGNRTSFVALVGYKDELKYILATENMKPGDIIRTHQGIPPNPIRPKEGDAYPLGALPVGTQVCCVEKYPGLGGFLVHAAGGFATVGKKLPNGYVVVKVPSKREFALPPECMATVGRLSNAAHGSTPVGSAQRNRWLGNRPRSGLKKKKTGVHGRKIKPPKPVKVVEPKKEAPLAKVTLNLGALN